jgi:predicted amidohydrolase
MRICTFQIPMAPEVSSNVTIISRCLSLTAESEGDVAVLPEMAVVGYDSHLHDLFQREGWYSEVLEGLEILAAESQRLGLKAFIGTPFRQDGGYQNAMVLLGSDGCIRYAGGRKIWSEGWRKYGFSMPERKDPVQVGGYAFGFVICSEASQFEQLEGTGIEKSDVILWPAVTRNYFNDPEWGTRDNCRLEGASIAKRFNTLVLQSSYSTYVRGSEETVKLGGIVIVDSDGTILDQAPYDGEAFLTYDLEQSST